MNDPIGHLVTSLLSLLTPILTPDWGALIGLLPIFLLVGVVGPIVSLLVLGWFIYVVRAPRARMPYREPLPVRAPLADGIPVYPAGEPYCLHDQLILPPGSTTCPVCGREAAVRCPKCGVGRAAYLDTCANCGLVLRIKAVPARSLQPAGPPPGGAAAA
ncbi:MAG TPA: hypothetical protein VKR30_10835 [Candidatus Limnocylindrales bacterium]|nr:hypothetical protein [Candidatus Limnocylindrales bacterium]